MTIIPFFLLILQFNCGYGESWYREVSFTSSATYFTMHGRGDTTIIGGIPTGDDVLVYNQNELSTRSTRITLRQTINSIFSNVDNFGRDLALEGDDVTGNLLIIGANGPNSYKQYNGGVYFYTGDNSQWSFQQTILVKAMMNEPWSYYGVALDLDTVTERRLVIGCANCTTSSEFLNDGSIYVFEPISSPRVVAWTEQQRLTSNNLHAIGTVDVEIYRDTILGVGYLYRPPRSINTMNGIIFQRDIMTGQWSEVQTLTPKAITISDVDLYDDTMVIGSSNYVSWGTSNAGAVLVFYPNTPKYSLQETDFLHSSRELSGPKVQWSQQQTLTSPNSMVNGYYGSTVKLWGNVMAITEPGSGKVYVLERHTRSGMWSQQIAISAAVSASLTAEVKGSDVVVGDGTNAHIYTNNRQFNCLHISLEDHFGDGWGMAKLIVESTEFGLESFSPGCDRENPLGMRFCAIDNQDNGHYKFRIVDYEKAEFHWEILWRVYDERAGEWHIGNWLTEMEFDWAYHEEGFHNKRVIRPLPDNSTCKACPRKPTTRTRMLKSGTNAPTVSPAPTLAISSAMNWKYLILQDTANNPWFNSYHHGTSYYVSDIHGRQLVSIGTICSASTVVPQECWLDLPSGDYILRIGGALDEDKSTHLWRFCSMTADLPPQTHLEFTVTDDRSRCVITSFYNRNNYCDHVANYDVVLKIFLYFTHSQNLEKVSLSSSDREIINGALKTLLSPYTLNSIVINTVTDSHLILHLSLHWGTNIFQSEEVYHEQIKELSSSIHSQLTQAMPKMLILMNSMSSPESLLHHMSEIYLEMVEYDGISGGYKDQQEVVSVDEEKTQTGESNDNERGDTQLEIQRQWSSWNIVAWCGWILLATSVVSVAVIGVWLKKQVRGGPPSKKEGGGGIIMSCVADSEQNYSPLDTSLDSETSFHVPEKRGNAVAHNKTDEYVVKKKKKRAEVPIAASSDEETASGSERINPSKKKDSKKLRKKNLS